MIVTKNGKSYDTADGSEQPFANFEFTLVERRQGQNAARQWADDGGAPLSADVPLAEVALLPEKPGWSVLSLPDLNDAILREYLDGPARQERDRERARLDRETVAMQFVEQAAAAERNCYRNAWENT